MELPTYSNMTVSYHKVPSFPFYSPEEFTIMKTLGRSKHAIYQYQHNESGEVFVVKQVPYCPDRIKIYEVVMRLHTLESIVRLRGMCRTVLKYGYGYSIKKRGTELGSLNIYKQDLNTKRSSSQHKTQPKQESTKGKQIQSLLLFFQKCEEDLGKHILSRKARKQNFKCEEITTFLTQTLLLLEALQRQNISHRDIKPQNFLCDKGRFKICDFDDAVLVDFSTTASEGIQLDLTTLQYSSPEFFRSFKDPKPKVFNPYKLDVYALGVTIIYMCSVGSFDLQQRRQYLVQSSGFHSSYMKEQRRRYLKNNEELKGLSSIVKMMIEEDEYKRDTFVTLLMKVRPMISFKNMEVGEEESTISDNSKSQSSRRKTQRTGKSKRRRKWEGTTEVQRKCLRILLILGFSFFVLLLLI